MAGVVVHLRLELAQAPRQRDAADEGCGEFEPVVPVELHLGQQVAAGDAQEDAAAERQGKRGDLGIMPHADHEEERADRHDHGERQLDQHRTGTGHAPLAQQRRQRHGIEGLVRHDHQQRAQARKPAGARLGLHARRQRHALQHAVHREAKQRTHPTQPRRPGVSIGVRMRRVIVFVVTGVGDVAAGPATAITAGRAVLVHMERREPFEQEEHREAQERPEHDVGRGGPAAVHAQRMGQQVEEDDAQDHAADGAEHQLQRRVRQAARAHPCAH